MPLFALTPETSDFLTVWGFVATLAGTLVGVLGFGYTIYQVLKVKAAAEAAEAAAKKALAESKEAYERFVGAFATRLLSELQSTVTAKDWKLAVVRANDLAELFGSLPQSQSELPLTELIADLRAFSQVFAEKASGQRVRFDRERWRVLLNGIHTRLDTLKAPFRGETTHESRSDDPYRPLPTDRPSAP